ncbi:eight-cysteine-cluster domain-containing protein [Candidatus Woesearchaeota archaeon]|nr:eight-cysteine-cluster domain-containing protein [Candidatus Woesearchaeota archaeon]
MNRYLMIIASIGIMLILIACQQQETDIPDRTTEPVDGDAPVTEPGTDEFCGTSTMDSCETDSDCRAGGCSGQVCESADSEGMMTTCEYMECYNNEKYDLECGCVDGACQWA